MPYVSAREPIAAGTFYEENEAKLIEQIEACFKDKRGPGKLPSKKEKKLISGLIVPHAGYQFSGACAANAYYELAKAKPDTIILIGPSHSGLGKLSVWCGASWTTPLGIINVDTKLAKEIADGSEGIFNLEPMPHMQEHSLEVQVPFLQYIFKNKVKIVPIVVASEPTLFLCKRAGEALAKTIQSSKKKVVVIVSSDFTHFGVSYSYLPFTFGPELRSKIADLDMKAVNRITKLQLDDFINCVKEHSMTICGATAIGILISYLKEINADYGKLLSYYMSGDLNNSYGRTVSYASILF